MAKKIKKASSTNVEANVDEIFSKSESFIETYRNHIIVAVAAIILIVIIILGVHQYYLVPKEKEAQAAIFPGENYLAGQQWDLALNGDGKNYIGFLGVIDDYGITKTAKLAKAYAGICYYHLNKPEDALNYLKKFNANDKVITPVIQGLIGDCYVDLGKVTEGVKCFDKAASDASSDILSPIYLKKAGIAYESISDYANAVKAYQTIKDKYPASQEAMDIEKYIERANLQIK
jgi:tetratricopeptide (TPR) repeat protein